MVGDFCQFSGLKLNMGKDKTAWMQANGKTDLAVKISVQDALEPDLKTVTRLHVQTRIIPVPWHPTVKQN